jgi:hypothetical protein
LKNPEPARMLAFLDHVAVWRAKEAQLRAVAI